MLNRIPILKCHFKYEKTRMEYVLKKMIGND